ncbi:peptide-methionine (S)-S-oxide reductase [Neolewinella agarilytica]|uniref:peptide-methionine (S)-S-oxide reductase n=1 Tax=Neolewinella agarilytica TaxID=478744 RepID=UPI0023567060|nr:peptide-methionine (S)-S-oxide reductase [Neolewinella agarilytica]
MNTTFQKIALGGGCHWCTEGVFVSLRGVARVEQGWVSSLPPNEAFSEAVIVHYDPEIISVEDLMAVHLETHAATKNHGLRHRYRSAVYYFAAGEAAAFEHILNGLAREYPEPILTQVLPFVGFKASLPEHQDYYRKDPEKPFCKRFIAPKLKALRQTRPGLLAGPISPPAGS